MFSEDGKLSLNSKIKIKIYVNELSNVEKFETDIQDFIIKYLNEQCGVGNFLYEADVQF